MRNIVLIIAYDGTGLLGWQKTCDGDSVEEILERVVAKILQHKVVLQAASRTDAGVHADGQVVNFFSNSSLPCETLLKGMNALLPKTIRVMEVAEKGEGFHPTLDARGKEYHYNLITGPVQMPSERLYSWHYPYQLNMDAMLKARDLLLGERDFAAMMGSCDPRPKSTIRRLLSIDIERRLQANYCFKIRGENFLYKMVRNIVGTLVYIGRGKIELESLPEILESGLRERAGVTAPANGLRLKRVFYDL